MAGVFFQILLFPVPFFVKKLDRDLWVGLMRVRRMISILVAHAFALEEYSVRVVGVCHVIPRGISCPHSLFFSSKRRF